MRESVSSTAYISQLIHVSYSTLPRHFLCFNKLIYIIQSLPQNILSPSSSLHVFTNISLKMTCNEASSTSPHITICKVPTRQEVRIIITFELDSVRNFPLFNVYWSYD